MGIRIQLSMDSWSRVGNCWSRGAVFHEGVYYKDLELCKKVESFGKEGLLKFLDKGIGNFSIVARFGDFIYTCVDLIRSFPLFYSFNGGTFSVSDSIDGLGMHPLILNKDQCVKREFLASGFVIGGETLYQDIFQVQAGEYIEHSIPERSTRQISYYEYGSTCFEKLEDSEYFHELDRIHERVASRLIETLKGRTAVIPLSGGFDSRLVAQMLKKGGYDKVVCFSYGGRKSAECRYSREIARSLGYKWIYIEQFGSKWKDLMADDNFRKYFEAKENCASIPYIQHYLGILQLKLKQLIPEDSVIVTGNSGDFLEGKNIKKEFLLKDRYSAKETAGRILHDHYLLNGDRNKKDPQLESRLARILRLPDFLDKEEAIRVCEKFNWRERQSKYVVSDSRAFEALGYDWRLPLWDKELMLFWDSVPVELKAERALYYRYVQNETIGNANHDNFGSALIKATKKYLSPLGFPTFIAKRSVEYFTHPYGWYKIVPFGEFMRLVFKTRGTSGFSICTVLSHLVSRELLG